jgi:hypothetical protein
MLHLTPFFTEWHGLDTLIVAAGVSALRPVLEIAGVEGPSVTRPSLDDVRRVEDVAMAAIKGNYLGPLLSVVTMVCLRILLTSLLSVDRPRHRSLSCGAQASPRPFS